MSDFEKKFEEANSHYEKHELDEALEIYEELYNNDYKKDEIIPAMIDLYLAKDDFDKANKFVDIIIEKDPTDLSALSIKSFILTSSNELDEALEYAEKIIDLDPNVEEGYLLKISILHLQHKQDEIEEFVDGLLENNPEVLKAIKSLTGLSAEDLKTGIVPEFDEDADACGPECDHDHHDHEHDHYDIDELDDEQVDELLKDLYKQIDESTEVEIERYLYKANGALRFQKFDEALDLINEALKIEDTNLDALLLKSAILFNQANFDDALDTINTVIKTYPDNADAVTFKGFIYLNLGDFKNAELTFKDALDLNDEDSDVWRQYSFAVASSGDNNRAIGINQKALKKFPENSDLWYDRYMFLTQIDSESKANEALEKCKELNPNQLDYQGNPVFGDNSEDFDDDSDSEEIFDLNDLNTENIELSPEEQRLFDLLSKEGYDSQSATEIVLGSYQEALAAHPELKDDEDLFKIVVDLVEEKINNK
ncbi:hypothetical protein BGI41_01735 [Methanobrevibacter sp. 87.7]|uniref:tetratricopeptide repeat protein n=1 Tax=Methanobrevibacter sp. 87.7 TaxID=387957 RepID=UPI000B50AF13|nr:tetratricopeptide repeat protein [Methanobrevibacter sp. 87.7]OWT33575.1 hypothetical protein BGI41_01735 [Methanobrevibacter sp. 87.7]